jgi:hypothetical protein
MWGKGGEYERQGKKSEEEKESGARWEGNVSLCCVLDASVWLT